MVWFFKKNKNYFFVFIFCLSLFFGSVFAFDFSWTCEKRTFIVTAYYSPLSGQTFFYKPSYQDEVILNGGGLYGASGKKVFNGMLAAPQSYDFGDIVYFPSLGIGEVADRGGAIVQSGERWHSYDRIDIWMGKWEEWLAKALTFGKKTLEWYYCPKPLIWDTSLDIWFHMERIPLLKHFFDIAVFIQELAVERQDIWVATLQKYLIKLWYLWKDKQTWYFGPETKKALCSYQLTRKITSKKYCGTFWKATRYTMKQEIEKKSLFPGNLWDMWSVEDLKSLAKSYVSGNVVGEQKPSPTFNSPNPSTLEGSKNKSWKTKNVFQFYRPYKKGDKNAEIKKLQVFLQKQWLYSGALDSIYSKTVVNAVSDFQIKYAILAKDADPSLRGYLGPKTREKINELNLR